MDLDIYTESMAKSNWDKAFFMDKIGDTKCIVDFGCADGAMIRMLAPLFPSITFIGYDSNKELIEIYTSLEKNILDDFVTPISNDMGTMVVFGKLTEQLKSWVRSCRAPAVV